MDVQIVNLEWFVIKRRWESMSKSSRVLTLDMDMSNCAYFGMVF